MEHPMTIETHHCVTCRHAAPMGDLPVADPAEARLQCRFNAPVALAVSGEIRTCWPRVRGTDWCSQHERVAIDEIANRVMVDTIAFTSSEALKWVKDYVTTHMSDRMHDSTIVQVRTSPETVESRRILAGLRTRDALLHHADPKEPIVLPPDSEVREVIDRMMTEAKKRTGYGGLPISEQIVLRRCADR